MKTRAERRAHLRALSRANKRLMPLVREHYAMIDETISREKPKAEAKYNVKTQCTKGCAHCCEVIVLGEHVEAEYIVARYPEVVREALPELRRQLALVLEHAPPGLVEAATTDRPAANLLAAIWRDLELPCALLDLATKECRVYDARPHACRTYFVTSPVSQCAVKHGAADLLNVANTVYKGHAILLSHVVKERGGDLAFGTLPELLLSAWDLR